MTNSKQNQTQKPRSLDWALIVALVTLIGSAIFFMGKFSANLESAHEKIKGSDEKIYELNRRIDNIFEEIKKAKDSAKEDLKEIASQQDDPIVFSNGVLGSGLNMGVDSYEKRKNWANVSNKIMTINYPGGQSWGSVFITIGEPTLPPRPARDYSKYRKLILELKGKKGGETVLIGLKDNYDLDDGSESKVRLNLTKDWGIYQIILYDNFTTADLTKLYVVTEFVFDTNPQTIYVRNIHFLK
ncbi:MAG: hypothetical protein HZB41_03075 [Ignavibacteriae bacterium]|nr:hypothetical protein [Ignavibacteriota bacterium]